MDTLLSNPFEQVERQESRTHARLRNIVNALDNLITQLDAWESTDPLAIELRAFRLVYTFEMGKTDFFANEKDDE